MATPDTAKRPWSPWAVLALNVAFLLAACLVQFYRHQTALFEDQDALGLLSLVQAARTWQAGWLAECWSPMSLLGGHLLFNTPLIPPLAGLFAGLPPLAAKLAVFTSLALELFLGMYALCRAFEADRAKALAAAWVCVNLVLPLQQHPVPLGQVFTVWPIFGHGAALVLFTLACFRLAGRAAGPAGNLAALAGFVLAATLQVIPTVGLAPLSVPPTALGCVFIALLCASRRELAWKAAAVLALCALMATGPLPWTIGKLLFSARSHFYAEMQNIPPRPFLVSSIFYGYRVTQAVVGLSVLGALLMAFSSQRSARMMALAFLLYSAVHAAYGAAYLSGRFDFRSLPHPIYMDYCATPLYAVFFCHALLRAWRAARGLLPGVWARAAGLLERAPLRAGTLLAVAAVAFLLVQGVSSFALKRYKHAPQLESTPIVETLKRETGLVPGADFRGRSTSLFMCGVVTDREAAAGLRPACTGGLSWKPGFNNAHALSNLWMFDIPTLDGYEQTLPLPYYLLYSRLASHAPWLSNYSGISRLRLGLLRASGARFVISPRALDEPGLAPRQYLLAEGRGGVQSGEAHTQAELMAATGGAPGVYLYELEGANLGQYSPVRARTARSINETLDILGAPGFDFAREVVLHEDLAEAQNLAPARLTAPLRLGRGFVRLEAESAGTGMLLLPFEFSRCLSWTPDPGGGQVRLFRADLALTAVLFTGRVSGVLRWDFGPWTHPWARMQDLRDLKALGLAEVQRHPLEGAARYFRMN